MTLKATASTVAHRILYTMVRVADLELSVQFYQDALGMHEQRRENYSDGRFTLVFMGYGDASNNAVIELTYNWDKHSCQQGTRSGHVALAVDNIYTATERLKKMGVTVLREAGPMSYTSDETGEREHIAFIEDPDGYKIELIQTI